MEAVATRNRLNGIDLGVLSDTVNAIKEDPGLGKCRFRATNQWVNGAYNRTTVSDFFGAKQDMTHKEPFELHADEPPILAGGDEAPNPVEHLLHALASCLTTSMVAHAAVNGIQIMDLEAELEGDIDLNGFLGLDPEVPKGYTDIRVTYHVKTDSENLAKLKRLCAFSPVYNTLLNGVHVDLQVEAK